MSKIMGRFVEILGAFLENFQRKLKWIYTVRFMVSLCTHNDKITQIHFHCHCEKCEAFRGNLQILTTKIAGSILNSS